MFQSGHCYDSGSHIMSHSHAGERKTVTLFIKLNF